MRRVLLVSCIAALVGACGFALDGYTGGPAPDGGVVLAEAGIDGGITTTDSGSPMSTDPPMLVTAETSGGTHIRRWNAATSAWDPPTDGPKIPNDDPIRGVTVRRSSVNGHRSLVIYTINEQTQSGSFYLYDWNGSSFVQVFTTTDFGEQAGWAPFDLAFDGKTGHGLVVYGSASSGNIRFRLFDGTKWNSEALAFEPTAPNDQPYQFVKLVTRPGADDMAVIWSDQGMNIFAAYFLGDHFGGFNELSAQTQNDVQMTFDGAFESTRGDLLLAWASNNTVFYSVSKAGSTAIANKSGDLMFAQTGRVVLAADPASDQIALVTLESACGMQDCDDFTGIIWTGTAWDTAADGTLDGNITTPYDDLEADAPATVTWSGAQAVAMYHRDSQGFRWGNWNAGVWTLQPDYAPATAIGQKASFVPFHVDGKLYTLVEDRHGVLWNVAYDGAAWHDDDGNAPIADDLPSPTDFNGLDFSTDAP